MKKEQLLHYVAPCSLMCYTCPALKDGAVSTCANQLCKYFEGYYDFNDAFIPEEYRSWLKEFTKFEEQLQGYTRSACPGCRNRPSSDKGCIEGCVVPDCVKEHHVDFCAECSEFPCERAKNFYATVNHLIGKDWEEGNKRIKEIGIEAYFEEKKKVSHYISYKKK